MSTDTVSWRETLAHTIDVVSDRAVARWLCEHASGLDGDEFLDSLDELVPARAGLHLEAMLRRYLDGEPLQYVMGRWAFRRLDLMVDRRVLIPRPETEQLVDIVLRHLDAVDNGPRIVVDLGTGSGAVGLSILSESPVGSVDVHLTDESSDALDVARANAAGVGRTAAGVNLHLGHWYDALPHTLKGRCDVLVSNPPYIADGDGDVEEIVRAWEPHTALFAGRDGLDDVRHIVGGAMTWLAHGGLLAIEIGHEQGDDVRKLLDESGLERTEILRDLSSRVRFATGYAPS